MELLIVIAIIGVLIGLLLPAIQQARESARRIHCASNLKQLALAALQYEDAHGMLPPSGVVEPIIQPRMQGGVDQSYPVFDQRSGKMFSWAVLLLPFLEETSLYDQFDLSLNVLEQPAEPQAEQVEVLLCPSDAARGRFYMDEEFTLGKRFGKGNYAAYVSPTHSDLQLLYPGALISTGQRLARIIDGTSHTIVFSEVRTLGHPQDERGAWALPWNAASLLSLDMHHDAVASGSLFAQFQPLVSMAYQAQMPNTIGPNADVLVRCPEDGLAAAQLERMPCLEWIGKLGLLGYISAAPRSNHFGGVNVAYLDGRVEFILDDIDPFVLSELVDIRANRYVRPTGGE